MSAIRLIERFKILLVVAELVFLAAFVAELYYLSRLGTITLGRTAAILVLLPPLGVWACFFPICYYFWFRNPSQVGSQLPKRVFFWLLVAGSTLIWLHIIFVSAGLSR